MEASTKFLSFILGDLLGDLGWSNDGEHFFCCCLIFFFQDRVSMCTFGACSGTPSKDQADLKLSHLPASASWVLGKICTPITQLINIFKKCACFYVVSKQCLCLLYCEKHRGQKQLGEEERLFQFTAYTIVVHEEKLRHEQKQEFLENITYWLTPFVLLIQPRATCWGMSPPRVGHAHIIH